MDYIFATQNPGKIREMRALFEDSGLTVQSAAEAGIDDAVEESGVTFAENAVLKAQHCRTLLQARGQLNTAALADDSGLVIDTLDGRPGVYSARFLGEDTPYEEKNRLLLDMLRDIPDEQRTARFVCVIACALPDGRVLTSEGTVEGIVAHAPRGVNGFGYDPIFFLPDHGLTMAELPDTEKNRISHRARAITAMRAMLADIR